MLKLRLKKFGRKRQPSYRLVVMTASTRRDGRAIEELGYYSTITKEFNIKTERINHWLKNGVQPTETVSNLLKKAKIICD
ncbi:MAG: 30S ribosomal protein S16 [Pelagibacterales bacterium]|nr:30S ribosomal protein S16 [Pelagibacterales bacterium]